MFKSIFRRLIEKKLSGIIIPPSDEEFELSILSRKLRFERIDLSDRIFQDSLLPLKFVFGFLGDVNISWDSHMLNDSTLTVKVGFVDLKIEPKFIGNSFHLLFEYKKKRIKSGKHLNYLSLLKIFCLIPHSFFISK